MEEELRGIAERQEVNVNKLVELVKENGEILAKMRVREYNIVLFYLYVFYTLYISNMIHTAPLHNPSHENQDNLRQRIVQDIITIVVKSDRDNDQTIDKSEAKTLALRIRLSLQEYGVQFDSDKFLKAIGDNPSVPGVIAIVQKLLPKPETGDDESADSDYDSDDEGYDSDEDDIYDMFYMDDDAARASCTEGGVSGSSGRRLSLMTCDKKKPPRRASLVSQKYKR